MIFALTISFLLNSYSADQIHIYTDSPFVVVDKDTSMLSYYKYEKNSFNSIYSSFFSYGLNKGAKEKEGDLKTPEGIFFSNTFFQRHELPSYFGAGAISLNYPNPIDLAKNLTGSNIWIHGIDDSNRLSNINTSRGCIIIENKDLIKLMGLVKKNLTPIIIISNLKKLNYSYSKIFVIKVFSDINYQVEFNQDRVIYKIIGLTNEKK